MELLDLHNYQLINDLIRSVSINNLFARAVLEHNVSGQIFADNKTHPQTAYIIHPYGMTLLAGDSTNQTFNESFRAHALNTTGKRTTHEWMQAWPDSWDNTLRDLFGERLIKSADNLTKQEKGIIELNTRVNFKFNKNRFLEIHKPATDPAITITRTDRTLFREMKGSVIPVNFWNSEEDFLENGLGFSLLYQGKLASMAFSSFWFDDQFELGIETIPGYRGKGLAEMVCSALIEHCIRHQLEPIWACRLENTGSYKLALKLGFEVAATIPYYRLSN